VSEAAWLTGLACLAWERACLAVFPVHRLNARLKAAV
jgi:hypothetical protein